MYMMSSTTRFGPTKLLVRRMAAFHCHRFAWHAGKSVCKSKLYIKYDRNRLLDNSGGWQERCRGQYALPITVLGSSDDSIPKANGKRRHEPSRTIQLRRTRFLIQQTWTMFNWDHSPLTFRSRAWRTITFNRSNSIRQQWQLHEDLRLVNVDRLR